MKEKNKIDFLLNKYIEFVNSTSTHMDYLSEYNTFSSSILKHTRPLLLEYNTTFQWERKGNTREGALTQKNLHKNVAGINLLVKVIKIRKDTEFLSQIHTYFHELTHLVCNHNDQQLNDYTLTTPQKEYVAEVTAQALLSTFVGGIKIEEIPKTDKWDPKDYILSWIKSGKFSDKKILVMWEQINFSYEKIRNSIIENIKTQD